MSGSIYIPGIPFSSLGVQPSVNVTTDYFFVNYLDASGATPIYRGGRILAANIIQSPLTDPTAVLISGLTSGFTYQVPPGVATVVLTSGSATLATGTISFPIAPLNSQRLKIFFDVNVTALSFNAPVGTTIGNPPTQGVTQTTDSWFYQTATAKWYKDQALTPFA